MKSIKEWLRELPEPYRTKALRNYDAFPWPKQNEPQWDLAGAVASAFHWDSAPEGNTYWKDIHKRIQLGYSLTYTFEDLKEATLIAMGGMATYGVAIGVIPVRAVKLAKDTLEELYKHKQ